MDRPPELVIPEGPFACTTCERDLPGTDFYWAWNRRDRRWQRDSRCKDCHNATSNANSRAKVINRRARQRATALLLEEYPERFAELLERERKVAAMEYDLLNDPDAGEAGYQRLRPGARRAGQTVMERLDVARCTICHTHHDRGHVCPKCGAATVEEIPTEEAEEEINWDDVDKLCWQVPGIYSPAVWREAVVRTLRKGMSPAATARWLHADVDFVNQIALERGDLAPRSTP